MRKIELKLDLYNKANIIKTLKQYDTTEIKAEIFEHNEKYDLSNKTVKYIFTRKDNTIIRDVATLTNDNVATFNLDEKCIQLSGYASFEVLIYENEELISTFIINFEIERSSFDIDNAKEVFLLDIDKKIEAFEKLMNDFETKMNNILERIEKLEKVTQKPVEKKEYDFSYITKDSFEIIGGDQRDDGTYVYSPYNEYTVKLKDDVIIPNFVTTKIVYDNDETLTSVVEVGTHTVKTILKVENEEYKLTENSYEISFTISKTSTIKPDEPSIKPEYDFSQITEDSFQIVGNGIVLNKSESGTYIYNSKIKYKVELSANIELESWLNIKTVYDNDESLTYVVGEGKHTAVITITGENEQYKPVNKSYTIEFIIGSIDAGTPPED